VTRLLPSTLFGRMVLVLVAGLFIAQLVGAAILLRDRSVALYEAGGFHAVRRIASIVQVLDALEPAQRGIALRAVNAEPLRVSVTEQPGPLPAGETSLAPRMQALLTRLLGPDRAVRAAIVERVPLQTARAAPPPEHMPPEGMHRRWARPDARSYRVAFVAQVALADGTWATFEHGLAREPFAWPYKLLLTLGVLLVSVVALALLAVRWVTRPLATLGKAAEGLGRDIDRPPLPESGPAEVRRAAQAFNAMQQRLQRFLSERAEFLAAVSHDLRTPLTRLKLRAEMIDDAAMRTKVLADVDEMERMTAATLDFLRGARTEEPVQPIDVNALLESLQSDFEAMGHEVTLEGSAASPFPGRPLALRRCLSNLVDNAVKYGRAARVAVEDAHDALGISVTDEGPGIPEDQLDRVFEPFYRIERSRSRETGGTGLGLSIARDIARSHGGELVLRNREGGGLAALLTLPR